MVLPLAPFRSLAPGDLLWVREGVSVLDTQREPEMLTFCYAGEARRYSVPWPAAIAKPGAGFRPAEAMPVQCSRFSLLLESVDHPRLAQVEDDDALCAGVTLDGPGFGALGFPFMMPFATPLEALQFLFAQHHGVASPNPEVALLRFAAISRNVAALAMAPRRRA